MKIKKKTLKIGFIVLISIVILGFAGKNIFFKENPAVTAFAQCLTENNAVMYGAYWCGHCEDQKKMFGSSFEYIEYVECDSKGKDADPQRCQLEGIVGYPTWKINGQVFSGTQSLKTLAVASGCEYGL